MTRWLVVGGGSAGCVVARRLSEVESNDVTLLEAGPDHGVDTRPAGEPVLDHPARLVRDALVVRRPGLLPQTYAQGFGLGGSSLVNGAVVVGDPVVASHGHALPVEVTSDLGPVANAALAATGDAAPVVLVRRRGRRLSAAVAYLRPVTGRQNLTVTCDVSVERLWLDGRRVVGAVTSSGDQLDADRVVLCAGATATPSILLRSGVDTPGVGADLQDHAGVAISFDLHRPSPTCVTIGVTVERPGRQIVVMDRLPERPDMGAVIAGRLAIESTGRVTLPDPDGPPLVELNQLASPVDVDGLVQVVREAFALLRAPELDAVIGTRYVDRDGTSATTLDGDEAALRAWLPDHLGGYHHVAGSCRIGVCLDEIGALHGYDGIYVCDASALPGVPSRNPYLAVIRQAESMSRRWIGA